MLRRICNHERWTVVGGLIGVALGAVGSTSLPSIWEGANGSVIFAGGGFGAAFGGVIAMLTSLRQAPTATPRVARSTAIELADYLPRGGLASRRLAPLLSVLAGLLAFALLSFVPRQDWPLTWPWVVALLIVLTLVSTVAITLVSHRVLERGQEAASDLELAWDDLVRAKSLRSLWGNVSALSAFSIVAAFSMVGDTVMRPDTLAGSEQFSLFLGAVAFVLACLLLVGLKLPMVRDGMGDATLRHVLNRLWPDATFRLPESPQPHTGQGRVT